MRRVLFLGKFELRSVYFDSGTVAGLALAAGFAAGLATAVAGASSDALSARFLSRLAAFDRLRVFSRELCLGIGAAPSSFRIENRVKVSGYILRLELAKIAGITKNWRLKTCGIAGIARHPTQIFPFSTSSFQGKIKSFFLLT